MKTQIDLARETRNLEKRAEKLDKDFLAFVSDRLRQADDLTTAEKYTLLTAFVEEVTAGGGIVSRNIFELSGADKTASKLSAVMHQYDIDFCYEEKRDEIAEALQDNAARFSAWDQANSGKSQLLPEL